MADLHVRAKKLARVAALSGPSVLYYSVPVKKPTCQSRPRLSDLIEVQRAELTSAKPKLVSRPHIETELKLCDLIRLDQIARSRGRNICQMSESGDGSVVKPPPPARTLPPRGLH